jgi:hypothetical protein
MLAEREVEGGENPLIVGFLIEDDFEAPAVAVLRPVRITLQFLQMKISFKKSMEACLMNTPLVGKD